MTTILYINHGHSQVCGVHDFGRRHRNRIAESSMYVVEYAECMSIEDYIAALNLFLPDAVIINFRIDLMPWAPAALKHKVAPVFSVVHNYTLDTADAVGMQHLSYGFDHALFVDPTVTSRGRMWSTGRAIPHAIVHEDYVGPPRIGSFGFAFPHKNFEGVAAAVDEDFDSAVYALHAPEAFFNGARGQQLYSQGIVDRCKAALGSNTLEYTGDHAPEAEVIERLGRNHINCLFYVPGQVNAGVSSALDYLVAARRPILVSDCTMFDYARHGVSIWPATRLHDIMDDFSTYQRQAFKLYSELSMPIVADTERIMGSIL